jgi:putative endonuclease
VGLFGEQLAVEHLEAAGLVVLDRNWRATSRDLRGEIDIVAREGDALVVCEVKTRSGQAFGSPAEAVTWRKQAQLRRLAVAWLAAHDRRFRVVRFDVVAVVRRPHDVSVEHIRSAF